MRRGLLAVLALLLWSCASDDRGETRRAEPQRPFGPSTTTEPVAAVAAVAPSTTASTTTTAPPVTEPPAPPDPTLRSGARGPEVEALQARLVELGYWLPAVDGVYGHGTSQAVMALQKAAGAGRDGIAGVETLALLQAPPETPAAAHPELGQHVEILLDQQLMLLVDGGGSVTWVLNTSTGASGWRTPRGQFEVYRVVDGSDDGPFGPLWRPRYFIGGIALHGSGSIPGYPASHGCARLSNAAIDMIWADDWAPIGTPVVVI